MKLSRRDFVKCAGAAAAASASLGRPPGSGAAVSQPGLQPGLLRGPNFLIILCDLMRFPPVYESDTLKAFRRGHLRTQDLLRKNGVEFKRHYASSACAPSRTCILTGHYPSMALMISGTV